jgi:Zn-dependent protease with chaperone function
VRHLSWWLLSFLPTVFLIAVIWVVAAALGGSTLVITVLVAYVVGDAYNRLARRGSRLRFLGVQVTEETEPELWRLVHEVVELPARTTIDGLWLTSGADAGALVGHRDWLLRRHVGLVLGLLTVTWLDTDCLRAVLAHEAGHLTDRDLPRLVLSQRRYRARSRVSSPLNRPLRWSWRWWLGATRELAIDTERHADRVSATLTTELALRQALGQLIVADIVHTNALDRLHALWDQGIGPKRIRPLYENAIAAIHPGTLSHIEQVLAATPAQAEDTHPGAFERGAILPTTLPRGLPHMSTLQDFDYFDRATTACTPACTPGASSSRSTSRSIETPRRSSERCLIDRALAPMPTV